MNEYLVADLMTIEPVMTSPNAPATHAARLLELYEISGLPVLDSHGNLVGVISQTDLLRGSRRRRPTTVADLMSSPAITVDRMAGISEAARVMTDRHVHRVVAIDAVGRPVGVLSSMDIVALVADLAAPLQAS